MKINYFDLIWFDMLTLNNNNRITVQYKLQQSLARVSTRLYTGFSGGKCNVQRFTFYVLIINLIKSYYIIKWINIR